MSAGRTLGWGIIAGFVALLLWILGKHTTLASGVKTGGSVFLTTPDPITGCPQFDSAQPQTIPPGQGIPALTDPVSGAVITLAPAGYSLWKDQTRQTYWYFPTALSGVQTSSVPVTPAMNAAPPYLT